MLLQQPRIPMLACSLFSTTLFEVHIPLSTPQGRRAQHLETRPECWIRGLHKASTQGIEATSANLFRKPEEGLPWDVAKPEGASRPLRPQMLIFRNAIVTSQPWYRLADGQAGKSENKVSPERFCLRVDSLLIEHELMTVVSCCVGLFKGFTIDE